MTVKERLLPVCERTVQYVISRVTTNTYSKPLFVITGILLLIIHSRTKMQRFGSTPI